MPDVNYVAQRQNMTDTGFSPRGPRLRLRRRRLRLRRQRRRRCGWPRRATACWCSRPASAGATEDFPKTNWNLRKFLWLPALFCYGIQRLTLLRDVLVLSGAGVGGGSLVYANTLLVPPDDGLPARQLAARRRLAGARSRRTTRPRSGCSASPRTRASGEGDRAAPRLRPRASAARTPSTRPHVGVLFGERRGSRAGDPYFGGEGPERADLHPLRRLHGGLPARRQEHPRQELPLVRREARRRGAARDAGDRASSRWPAGGAAGYRLTTRALDPQAAQAAADVPRPRRGLRRRRAGHGQPPAAQCREAGALPRLSPALGRYVRTNSEVHLRLHRAQRRGGLLAGASPSPAASTPIRRHLRGGRPLPRAARTPWASSARC